MMVESESVMTHLRALERAESVLIEHSEPAVAEPEPELIPEPEPAPAPITPERVRRDLDAQRQARHEAEEQADRRANPRHYLKHPDRVSTRATGGQREAPTKKLTRKRLTDGPSDKLNYNDLSPTQLFRADLLYDLLLSEGAMSQHAITVAMSGEDMLNCGHGTAASIVSDSLSILQHQRRVMWTGQKVDAGSGRADSAVWKARRDTPEDQSSAGVRPTTRPTRARPARSRPPPAASTSSRRSSRASANRTQPPGQD
jgi:hypothetical protein